MSKPLELHWYPCEYDQYGEPRFYMPGSFPLPGAPVNHEHSRRLVNAVLLGGALWEEKLRRKRLTDTELAAEYWAAAYDYTQEQSGDNLAKALTFRRFATHPHYDEEN